MIKPSIGRVVLFHPAPTDPIAFSDQPLAAHVAYVWSERLVNLLVIDSNGGTHARTSVTLLQDDETAAVGQSYAEWMPYQKGQAAKTEAAEAALATVTDNVTPQATPKADAVAADEAANG